MRSSRHRPAGVPLERLPALAVEQGVLVEAGSPGKRVVLDYLRAGQTRDLQLLDRVVISDFSHERIGERQDRASLFAAVEGLPFVDARFEVDALVEEGDQVACRYRFFAETSAGRPVAFSAIINATLRDGRPASGWGEYDATRLRRHITRQPGGLPRRRHHPAGRCEGPTLLRITTCGN